jgi:hypothetical protein
VGQIGEELKRRGISSDERVTLTIEPAREVIPGRRESRARVVAAGLTDDDIDRLIKQAQREIEPSAGREGCSSWSAKADHPRLR